MWPGAEIVLRFVLPIGTDAGVGGGHESSGLSDVALDWLIANAASHGIVAEVETHPDASAPIHVMDGIWRREDRVPHVNVDDVVSDLEPLIEVHTWRRASRSLAEVHWGLPRIHAVRLGWKSPRAGTVVA